MMVFYYVYLRYILYTILAVTLPIAGLIAVKIIQKLTTGRCKSVVCLNGKTALVTGGNTGIGFQTALILASRGCRVIIADKDDSTKSRKKIIEYTNNTNVISKHLNLASIKSIRKFADDINATEDRLDILINNAGVGSVGNAHTEDGLHATMQINHFGPFLLTHLLVDLLKKSAPSRIIFVSSLNAFVNNLRKPNLNYPKNHPLSFVTNTFLYGNSKLCNIISANGFSERLRDFGVTSNSVHPGLVKTDIFAKSAKRIGVTGLIKLVIDVGIFLYGKSIEEGAQTTLHAALSNKVEDVSGRYFVDCRPFLPPPSTWNKKFCEEIWLESEKLVGLLPEEKLPLKTNPLLLKKEE